PPPRGTNSSPPEPELLIQCHTPACPSYNCSNIQILASSPRNLRDLKSKWTVHPSPSASKAAGTRIFECSNHRSLSSINAVWNDVLSTQSDKKCLKQKELQRSAPSRRRCHQRGVGTERQQRLRYI